MPSARLTISSRELSSGRSAAGFCAAWPGSTSRKRCFRSTTRRPAEACICRRLSSCRGLVTARRGSGIRSPSPGFSMRCPGGAHVPCRSDRSRALPVDFREMHPGFSNLRLALPMNLNAHYPGFRIWARAQADIYLFTSIWEDCPARYGGPYLFGDLSVAARVAPVCTRFRTPVAPVTSGRVPRPRPGLPLLASWIPRRMPSRRKIQQRGRVLEPNLALRPDFRRTDAAPHISVRPSTNGNTAPKKAPAPKDSPSLGRKRPRRANGNRRQSVAALQQTTPLPEKASTNGRHCPPLFYLRTPQRRRPSCPIVGHSAASRPWQLNSARHRFRRERGCGLAHPFRFRRREPRRRHPLSVILSIPPVPCAFAAVVRSAPASRPRGLVHEHDLRLDRQRAGDPDALLHAAGEGRACLAPFESDQAMKIRACATLSARARPGQRDETAKATLPTTVRQGRSAWL